MNRPTNGLREESHVLIHPVIIGPKTRLARTLVAQLQMQPGTYARATIVARDEIEKKSLCEIYSQSLVIRFGELWPLSETERVAIFCCALGPVNTKCQNKSRQVTAALEREITGINQILSARQHHSLCLIFVSSVLAWSSSPNRFLYSGSKRLGESALRDMASAHPACSFSVVYPGRLVDERQWTNLLSTRYCDLAKLMLRIANQGPQTRIVGWDARLLLVRDWLLNAFRPYTHHGRGA